MKRALLLYKESYYKGFVNKKSDFKNYEITALNLDDNIFLNNLGNNVIFKKPWDYFSFSELAEIDKTALHIAQNWYMSEKKDISVYQDISIGEVIQYEIMTYFVGNLKALALIYKVIDIEKIDEIFLFERENIYEQAALIIGEYKNIKITKFGSDLKKTSPKKTSIKKHFKLVAVSVLLAIHNLIRKRLFIQEYRSKKNILIVNSYRFPPLIRELIKDGEFSLSIFVIGYTKELIKNHFFGKENINLIGSYSFRDLFFKNRSRDFLIAERIYDNLEKNIKEKINKLEIFGLEELVKYSSPTFIIGQIMKVVKNYRIINKWVVKDKLDSIIVEQDYHEVQRLIVELGNARGIPTMVLQHGVAGRYPFHVSPLSKIVGIWGEKWSDWFNNYLGIGKERIRVTGEPYYDSLLKSRNEFDRNSFLNKYRIPKGKKVILYAYQPNVTTSAFGFMMLNEILAYQVFKDIGNNENYWIIFKMRPCDSVDKGLKIVKCSGAKNITVISKTDNFKLIRASDLIITRYSTMALEGILLNKPVVILDFPRENRETTLSPFLNTTSVRVVDKEEDFSPTIEKIFKDTEVKKSLASGRKGFLKKYLYSAENSSSHKTVECIKSMIYK